MPGRAGVSPLIEAADEARWLGSSLRESLELVAERQAAFAEHDGEAEPPFQMKHEGQIESVVAEDVDSIQRQTTVRTPPARGVRCYLRPVARIERTGKHTSLGHHDARVIRPDPERQDPAGEMHLRDPVVQRLASRSEAKHVPSDRLNPVADRQADQVQPIHLRMSQHRCVPSCPSSLLPIGFWRVTGT